jgi:glycosyltransferase involved in cell wall biosynthesis
VPGCVRDFDIVMVASWASLKRHRLLFETLSRLKPRQFRVALIGYPLFRSVEAVKREMSHYGVENQCTIFESIPPEEVAQLLSRSKVALHLSRFEGANRGVYEAFFCDTPSIIYKHNIGFNMDHVSDECAILADDRELGDAIMWALENTSRFQPRAWALRHTGYLHSTTEINGVLRELALANGEDWTVNIAPKVNSPHLRYKLPEDAEELEEAYVELADYLL